MKTKPKCLILAVFYMVVGVALLIERAAIAQPRDANPSLRVVPDSSVERDMVVRSPKGEHKIRFYTVQLDIERSKLARTERVYLQLFFDQESGYFFWNTTKKKAEHPNVAWSEKFWVIPDYGFVYWSDSGGMVRVFISNAKAATLDIARDSAIAQAEERIQDGEPLTSGKVLESNFREVIGRDFFIRPGDAAPPPESRIISVNVQTGKWTIEIESSLTGEKAVIETDSSLSIQKAVRGGKTVFPKTENQ